MTKRGIVRVSKSYLCIIKTNFMDTYKKLKENDKSYINPKN